MTMNHPTSKTYIEKVKTLVNQIPIGHNGMIKINY